MPHTVFVSGEEGNGGGRGQRVRQWLRSNIPWSVLHCLFVAQLVLLPYPRVYRSFYYVALLLPFVLAIGRADLARLSRSWVLRACLAYLFAIWLALAWSPEAVAHDFSALGRRLLSAFAFVALTAWIVAGDERHLRRLLRAIAWAALLVGVASAVLMYSEHPLSQRLRGLFWTNPNTAGAIFGIALVAAAVSLAGRDRRAWRIADGVATALLFLLLLLTGSRAAALGAVWAVTVCLVLRGHWRPLAALAVLGLLYVALVSRGAVHPAEWLMRADNNRFSIWSHFAQLILERPLLGYGHGRSFAPAVTTLGGFGYLDPHNTLLATWLRGGALAAAAFLVLAIAMLRAGARHWERTGGFAALALPLYLLAQGLFETMVPIESPSWVWLYFWVPVGVAAGVEVASQSSNVSDRSGWLVTRNERSV